MNNLRKNLRERAKKSLEKNNNNFSNDKLTLPYHALNPNGGDAVSSLEIRLLADANPENQDMYYVNDTYHALEVGFKRNKDDQQFTLDKSGNKIPEVKYIACAKARNGSRCPICEKANDIYKTITDVDLRKSLYGKFKKKLSYISQVYVVNVPDIDAFKYTEADENGAEIKHSRVGKINLIKYGKTIQSNIDTNLNDNEFWEALTQATKNDEITPFEWGTNYNYILKASMSGEFKSYVNSAFTRTVKTIEKPEGLETYDLSQFQRKLLNIDELEALVETSYNFVTGSENLTESKTQEKLDELTESNVVKTEKPTVNEKVDLPNGQPQTIETMRMLMPNVDDSILQTILNMQQPV